VPSNFPREKDKVIQLVRHALVHQCLLLANMMAMVCVCHKLSICDLSAWYTLKMSIGCNIFLLALMVKASITHLVLVVDMQTCIFLAPLVSSVLLEWKE